MSLERISNLMKTSGLVGIGLLGIAGAAAVLASRKPDSSEVSDEEAIKILAVTKRRAALFMKGEDKSVLWALVPKPNEEGEPASAYIAGLIGQGNRLYVRKDADYLNKSFAIVAAKDDPDPWHYSLFLDAAKLLRIGKAR